MERIGNYEYYSAHGLLLCSQHSSAISLEFLEPHLISDLHGLKSTIRSTKKSALNNMVERIKHSLLPLATITANINALSQRILPFPLLGPPVLGYYCKISQCDFLSQSEKLCQLHIRKTHTQIPSSDRLGPHIGRVWTQYLLPTKKNHLIKVDVSQLGPNFITPNENSSDEEKSDVDDEDKTNVSSHQPRVDKEGQELFLDKTQYPVFLKELTEKHHLEHEALQKLTIPWQAATDDRRCQVICIASLDFLQRVSAQLSLLSPIQLNILKSFRPNTTSIHPFYALEPATLIRYSRVLSSFFCYIFRLFRQQKLAKTILKDLLASSPDFRDITSNLHKLPLPEEPMDLWGKPEDHENGDSENPQDDNDAQAGMDDEEDDEKDDEEDGDRPYVFEEENSPSSASLSANPPSHNHALICEMEEKCYSKTVALKEIQKLLLRLMQFLITYELDVHLAVSPLYTFLAISTIHTIDRDQMRDSMFFSQKYSSLIHTNILYTIGICLQSYARQDFSLATSKTVSFTSILRQFTEAYCKNNSPNILSHLYIMRTWAFGINKTVSRPPSIVVLDKTKALIRCKNVKIDSKGMQMFFEKIIYKAYTMLMSDLLLGLDLDQFSELDCAKFSEYDDFSNHKGGMYFAKLAKHPELKRLSSALSRHILAQSDLRSKFINKTEHWSKSQSRVYFEHVQGFLHILLLLCYISGSLPPRATELGTAKYQNSWETHQRNVFLDPESHLFVFKLTYHKTAKMTRREATGAHYLPSCVSYLVLVYLILVLPFLKMLDQKIDSSRCYGSSSLLFQHFGRPFGTHDLADTMIKYSVEFLGMRMLPSTYRHIIIGMIRSLTTLEINDATGAFILQNIQDVGSELGAIQAHHSQNIREKQYAGTSRTLRSLTVHRQAILLQYCQIYHTVMGFDQISFSKVTVSSSALSVRKHGSETFSPQAIRVKKNCMLLTGDKPVYQLSSIQEINKSSSPSQHVIPSADNPFS